ncbi:MAG: GNAT family N-acetyltransferase [Pirellulaceae bacterium]
MTITYSREPVIAATEFADVLNRSNLSERRPADDLARLEGMLRHADVLATARDGEGLLIGVSRAISDFHYCTYLSDLAVDQAYQRQGIGKQLIHITHEFAGLNTTLILLSAPAAREYYPRIGMQHHDSCWIIPAQ